MTNRCFACVGWLLALVWVAVLLPAAAQARAAAPDVVPDEIVVGLRPAVSDWRSAAAYASAFGRIAGVHPELGVLRVKLAPGETREDAMARLRRHPDVAYAEPNHLRHKLATPNDPYFAASQWGPQQMRAQFSWSVWQPRAQVIVAIVDTGIDYTHPDLQGVLLRDNSGAVVGHNSQNTAASADDDEGHGTHCAGIAAAQINNNTGIAGVAGWNPAVLNSTSYVKLMPVKVLNQAGAGTDTDVADGIKWAVDHGAGVVSLSLGGSQSSTTLSNAVKYALAKGAVVVAAAGNDGTSALSYPGAYSGVISVAATDGNDRIASFSNYGSWVKVAAPGVDIISTYPGGGYQSLSGTSMAAPHVAGEAAALRAQSPSLTNTQVASLITANVDAYQPYRSGGSLASNAGRANVYQALLAAGTGEGTGTGVLASVSLAGDTVSSGAALGGTVSLDGPASAGGVNVTLASDNPAVTVPGSVTVFGGGTTAGFTLHASTVTTPTLVTLTATLAGVSKSTTVTVTGLGVALFTLSSTSIAGGTGTNGTIYLTGNAPTGGLTATLSSSDPAVALPATVTVPSRAASVLFRVSSTAVAADRQVTLTAALNGTAATALVTIKAPPPPTLAGFTLTPATVKGGKPLTGKVTLSGPAPPGGATVALASSKPNVVPVPASVPVEEGAATATFTFATRKVSGRKSVSVTAGYSGKSRKSTVTVKP